MKLPRIMIAAGASGSGKTLITCGILKAMIKRGLSMASFKCGPDYIDPMFHRQILGTTSGNLDPFFAGKEQLNQFLRQGAHGHDLAVIEGVMGYYDGLGGVTDQASSFELAKITDTPTIFVVNGKGMSLSIVAYIKGFLEFRDKSQIKGVILNQVSPMMYPKLKDLIETELPVKVYGYLPKNEAFTIESRYLGLTMPEEIEDVQHRMELLGEQVEQTIDLDGILELAYSAGALNDDKQQVSHQDGNDLKNDDKQLDYHQDGIDRKNRVRSINNKEVGKGIKIAVARDAAFSFVYEENLELLKDLGVEIIEFSPLSDEQLPKGIKGIILPGGYPELHAKRLHQNDSMRRSIKDCLAGGIPCMAECGGFLYLHEELKTPEGVPYGMIGFVKGSGYKEERLGPFGYATFTSSKPIFGKEGIKIKGHEYHYYRSTACGVDLQGEKPVGGRTYATGHVSDQYVLGFPHLAYYSNIELVKGFLERCAEYES